LVNDAQRFAFYGAELSAVSINADLVTFADLKRLPRAPRRSAKALAKYLTRRHLNATHAAIYAGF
jgi:hypothetical protein